MNFPSRHHPLKSIAAMRFCCALEQDQSRLHAFAEHAFDAYFTHQRDLDDIACLIDVANEVGLPGLELAAQVQSDGIKAALRRNTDEAIARGAFGSPMIFVDGEFVYFGNDQLPLVQQRIQKQLIGGESVDHQVRDATAAQYRIGLSDINEPRSPAATERRQSNGAFPTAAGLLSSSQCRSSSQPTSF